METLADKAVAEIVASRIRTSGRVPGVPMESNYREWVTARMAAFQLKVPISTVRRLVKSGLIESSNGHPLRAAVASLVDRADTAMKGIIEEALEG